MNINQIVLSGRIGADPELRYTPNKLAILTFSFAQNDYQKDKEARPMWFDVIVFDKYAESLHLTIKKSDEIVVTGKLKISNFQGRDGLERKSIQITANSVRLLTYRHKNESAQMSTTELPSKPKQDLSLSDEDIPF